MKNVKCVKCVCVKGRRYRIGVFPYNKYFRLLELDFFRWAMEFHHETSVPDEADMFPLNSYFFLLMHRTYLP